MTYYVLLKIFFKLTNMLYAAFLFIFKFKGSSVCLHKMLYLKFLHTDGSRVTTISAYAVSRLQMHPPHKNIKGNNIEAVKLDHCDQELQQFHTAILGSLVFIICIVNDINNCELL